MNDATFPVSSNRYSRSCWRRWPLLLALTLACGMTRAETPAPAESLERLGEIAHAFLMEQVADDPAETRVEIRPLDARLRLARCDAVPTARLAPGARLAGATNVNLRCASPVQWSVFMPARIERHTEVVVVARPLARQQLIGPEDVRLERTEVSGLAGGYFDAIEAVAGQQARRALTPGQVVTGAHLAPRQLVRQGQSVVLIHAVGGLEVRMSGEALESGALGQRIRVRNISSRRIVEGQVQSQGHVQVSM